MEVTLSPEVIFGLFFLAVVIDLLTLLPAGIRGKLIFLFTVAAWRQGFDGSPLDRWTVGKLSDVIGSLLEHTDGTRLAGLAVNFVLTCLVITTCVLAVCYLMPVKWSKKTGGAAKLTFADSPIRTLSWQPWLLGFLIGIMVDIPPNGIGPFFADAVDFLTPLVGIVPEFIFGDGLADGQ